MHIKLTITAVVRDDANLLAIRQAAVSGVITASNDGPTTDARHERAVVRSAHIEANV